MPSPQPQPDFAWINSTKGHSDNAVRGPLRTVIPTSRKAQIGGDAMVGGHFKEVLEFDNEGNISAEGPLRIEDDEELLKFHVCVLQTRDDDTGAVAIWVENGSNARVGSAQWKTSAVPNQDGQFWEGPALGMALAIVKKDKSMLLYPWVTPIQLKPGGNPLKP